MIHSSHRCWCEVSLGQLHANLQAVRSRITPTCGIIAVIKANAYGHGLVPIAHFLDSEDCAMLGCAHVAEAITLRQAGVVKPILLLSSFLPEEVQNIIHYGIDQVVSSAGEIELLETAAEQLRSHVSVHLKIDTGMSRLGITPTAVGTILATLKGCKWVKLKATCTHFACADSDEAFTRKQWDTFVSAAPKDIPSHACNSAAITNLSLSRNSFVRPGICLYGISPVPEYQKFFQPILSWKSRVTLLKDVPPGTSISYGATYTTTHAMRIAVVAVGYGDGLFRHISNRSHVLIHGKRCPILGRVTMDQIIVDVSTMPQVARGDIAVLLGKQGDETITAEDMAQWAETIPWEIWCHITERVERIYLNAPPHEPS